MSTAGRARRRPRRKTADERIPRGWARHPRERMLITPLARRHRRPARVLHGRRDRRLATDPHLRPAAVRGLGAALEPGASPAASSSRRTAATSATPATRGRRTSGTRSTSSTRRSRSPATSTAATSRRTCSAPSAPGPTSRRKRAGIPTTGSARTSTTRAYVDPLSLMPPMKSLFSDQQVEELISFVAAAQRQVGPPALRRPALLEARRPRRTRGSSRRRPGFQGAHRQIPRSADREATEGPARGGAEPRPDRPRLLALRRPAAGDRGESDARQEDLPRALRRLPRARRRRQGPRGEVHVAAARRLHRQGRRLLRRRHRAGRLLLPDPARLARHRRWRTSATASRSTTSGGSSSSSRRSRTTRSTRTSCRSRRTTSLAAVEGAPRLARDDAEADAQRRVRQEGGHRSVHAGGDAGLPGPRTRRQLLHQRHDGDAFARCGPERDPHDLPGPAQPGLGRGEGARREAAAASQKNIPPEVPGQQ